MASVASNRKNMISVSRIVCAGINYSGPGGGAGGHGARAVERRRFVVCGLKYGEIFYPD